MATADKDLGTSGEFDVVVVGGGAAGCVLARRLVDTGLNVLLLEAGAEDDANPYIHDPGTPHELWHSNVDWDYFTDPQEALDKRELHWPRGKVLGGSGALNGMIYIRGAREDYDTWAYLGCTGWGYDDVLPRYKRMEDFSRGANAYHGAGGPWHVLADFEPHPVSAAYCDAAVQAGIPFNEDHNGAKLDGVGYTQLNIKDGRRLTAYGAFLAPVRGSANLTVVTGAKAARVLLEGTRCVGVEYEVGGERVTARATGEVVLCAGAIDSPAILLRSGIGPADELLSLDVEVVIDAPEVGANLHDHPILPTIVTAKREVPPPLPGITYLHAHLFWRSRPEIATPDLQPLLFHIPAYEPWMTGPEQGFTLMAGVIRPQSRGRLTLATADPNTPPRMDPRYLTEQADVDAMLTCVDLVRDIARQPAFAKWAGEELYPGPEVRSRSEILDYVRRTTLTYHHQVGTCRMGADGRSVVDPELRVRGIDGLRVADASVMPMVTSGNTAAPSMLIGDRAGDLVAESLRAAPVSSTSRTAAGQPG